MYIESVPNRNSPPAVLLRESYRENGKVRKRTLCNLSDWPAAQVEGLRGARRGTIPGGLIDRALGAGQVRLDTGKLVELAVEFALQRNPLAQPRLIAGQPGLRVD